MSIQSPLSLENDNLYHYETSIRNEYTRFALMFYLFTLFAFVTTIFLLMFANSSYYDESEIVQRRFIPYSVLGSISLILFGIFLIGSLVYTNKFIKILREGRKHQPGLSLSEKNATSIQINNEKSVNMSSISANDSVCLNTKLLTEKTSTTTRVTYPPCQTDV